MTDIYKNKALKYKLKYLKLKNDYIDNLKGGADKYYTLTERIANLETERIEEEQLQRQLEQERLEQERLEQERLRIQLEEQRRQPVVRRLQF